MAGTVADELSSLHPVLQPGLGSGQEGNSPVLVRSVLVLLSSISEYCGLAELLPQVLVLYSALHTVILTRCRLPPRLVSRLQNCSNCSTQGKNGNIACENRVLSPYDMLTAHL